MVNKAYKIALKNLKSRKVAFTHKEKPEFVTLKDVGQILLSPMNIQDQ